MTHSTDSGPDVTPLDSVGVTWLSFFQIWVCAKKKWKKREKSFENRQQTEMSYGKGDFGDSFGAPATVPVGSSSTNMDYSRLTSVVASNTTKIAQNNKEINRLAGFIGTDQDGASVREQL